jgi:integrase
MSKPKFPVVVKRGHTTVKIYLTPYRGSDGFTVVHYVGTKRQRKLFSDFGLAKLEAERIANTLSAGELKASQLTNEDSLAFARATQALMPTGVSLEMAAVEYADAWKILNGTSLLEAARFYARMHQGDRPKKTVQEVVDELIEAKEADKASKVYIKDLRGRLNRFAAKFPRLITSVSTGDIEDFLRDLKDNGHDKERQGKAVSGRSRNNYRRAIGTLFNYAEGRYLAKGLIDMEAVALARVAHTDIEIYTPAEMQLLLECAAPAFVPFLAIGAFAGLRHAELQRLDWKEVDLERGFIEVKASKAKTASRRLVPISENLKAWLTGHKKDEGKICEYASMSKQLVWLSEDVQAKMRETNPEAVFAWKHNALRHSFISYRVAQTQDVAKTSLEAGNSPRIVFANYRELVRPAEAQKWYGIMPSATELEKAAKANPPMAERPKNVVDIPKEAAA